MRTISKALFFLAVMGLVASCSTPGSAPDSEPSAGETPAAAANSIGKAGASLPHERAVGDLDPVVLFDQMMPTGVTVSKEGRVFVNFPRWGDDVPFTVAEIVDGEPIPYPGASLNANTKPYAKHFVSVQSVVVGPNDDLWVLDTGRPHFGAPVEGGQKLVRIDLETDQVVATYLLGDGAALDSTYLNDVRFDMRRGKEGVAFITDSSSTGPNGIIVVDLATKDSWRRLSGHPSTAAEADFLPIVEGRPLMRRPQGQPASYMQTGSDGIALSADGERLYYRPLSGHGLFSVSVDALTNRALSDEQVAQTVERHGDLGFASDGLAQDASGALYLTNYEDNAIVRRDNEGSLETIVHDPRALWPDTLAIGPNGYLYFTANQLHRQPSFHNGEDQRAKPYVLFRVKVGAEPVRLR